MKKQVTFYYVRHGQTLFNQLGRMQGWCDSPLTEKGREDARKAKEKLSGVDLKHAYASVSGRCRETCEILLEGREIPVSYRKELREYNFGTWEGTRINNHVKEIDAIRFHTFDWTEYGGENYEMVLQRVKKAWDEIYEEAEDGDHVLIVSHGAVFLHMIDGLFHLDKEKYIEVAVNENGVRMPVPNGYVGYFTCTDGEYELQYLEGRPKGFLEEVRRLSGIPK